MSCGGVSSEGFNWTTVLSSTPVDVSMTKIRASSENECSGDPRNDGLERNKANACRSEKLWGFDTLMDDPIGGGGIGNPSS